MRALLCLCLVTGLVAGEAPQPGRDRAFLARILGDSSGGARPWKTFRVQEASGSATVEVVGEFTPEELRQVLFQEFRAWFREDLRRFWVHWGGGAPPWSSDLPVTRYAGNPVPQNVPLGRVGF